MKTCPTGNKIDYYKHIYLPTSSYHFWFGIRELAFRFSLGITLLMFIFSRVRQVEPNCQNYIIGAYARVFRSMWTAPSSAVLWTSRGRWFAGRLLRNITRASNNHRDYGDLSSTFLLFSSQFFGIGVVFPFFLHDVCIGWYWNIDYYFVLFSSPGPFSLVWHRSFC